jgi:hypothetical protein
MKELISDPYQARYEPPRIEYPLSQKYSPPQREFAPPQISQPAQAQRQNNFINERELQKNKLQNQKHEGLFPTSSDRVRSQGRQQQQAPEQDHHQSPKINRQDNFPVSPKKNEYKPNFDPSYNPFVPDDAAEKQRKDEKNKEYLRALEEQRQEHERKRK